MVTPILVGGSVVIVGGGLLAYKFLSKRGSIVPSDENDENDNDIINKYFLKNNADAYYIAMQLSKYRKYDDQAFEDVINYMNDLCDIQSAISNKDKLPMSILRICQDVNVKLQDASRILEKACDHYHGGCDKVLFQDLNDFGKDTFFNLSQYTMSS